MEKMYSPLDLFMDGKLMFRKLVLIMTGLVLFAQANAESQQGAINRAKDSALFQQKCSSCHTIGLVSTGPDLLPSDIWEMVLRMAHYEGANIYCCDHKQRIYWYIVNFVANSRKDEVDRALRCLPENARICEQSAIDEAKRRYE